VRRLVYIFRNKRALLDQLRKECKHHNLDFHMPTLDMPERWNSTGVMLTTFIALKKAIKSTLTIQDFDTAIDKLVLTSYEWTILSQLSECFNIFTNICIRLQGDEYPTINYVLPYYLKLQNQLKEKGLEYPGAISVACQCALEKLSAYWKEALSHHIVSTATLLDPRFNLPLIRKLIDHTETVNGIKEAFMETFKKYEIRYKNRQTNIDLLLEENKIKESNSDHSDDDIYDSQAVTEVTHEIVRYFRERLLNRKTDIWAWWRSKEFEYPILSEMARDYLNRPATAASSEKAFSLGGLIVTRIRNRLGGSTGNRVGKLICLQSWGIWDSGGVVDVDGEGEEEEVVVVEAVDNTTAN